MGLVDPVKIYAATSNVEAQMICRLLQDAGVPAFAGEDISPAGLWIGGTIPGIFDAGVFVSRTDADRAIALIRQQERSAAERSRAQGSEVEATCEDCGKTSAFPATQDGTVQSCPHCGASVDVGEMDMPGDCDADSDNDENDERTGE